MACPEFYVSEKIGMAMGLNNRIGAQGGCQRVFPAIRLRGLPFHVTEDDIRLFLGCDTVDVLMVKKEGRFCGEAFVVLASCLLVDLALTKNKSYMGRRYIEIFRAKKIDYYRAVFAEMTEGSAQLTETRPRRTISDTRGSGETESKAARVVRTTVLKLRGLPFKATPEHVTEWFLGDGLTYETPITAENVYIVKDFGRASGIAFVEFAGLQDAQTAVTKDRQMLGTRYIEIFESTLEERARYMGR